MFDLSFSDEQQALVEVLRAFGEREVRPAAKDAERTGRVPDALAAQLAELGFAPPIAEELGGQGQLDIITSLIATEALAEADAGIAFATVSAGHAALVVSACGDDEQQARLLGRLASDNSLTSSLWLFEGFGRSPLELETVAVRDGDTWTINGRKDAVVHPNGADLTVIVAKDAAAGELVAFAVDSLAGQTTVVRDDQESGKLGLRAAPTGAVELNGLELGEADRLRGPGGAVALHRAISRVRLTNAAVALGLSIACLGYAGRYATERVAFGRPIIGFQGVAFPLVDIDMNIEATRLALWRAAEAIERSDDVTELERITGRVVAKAGSGAVQAARDGVQTLGGNGYTTEFPLAGWFRDAMSLSALDFDPLAIDLRVA